MIKNILQNIEGIEFWPLVSLIIFFVFFLILFIWILKVDKGYIKHMKELPIEDLVRDTSDNQTKKHEK